MNMLSQFRVTYSRSTIRFIALALILLSPLARADELDQYFDDFANEWVRFNPNLATATRYFTGAEQDQLERQISPRTRAWEMQRIKLAEKGLTGLKKFDREKFSPIQRVSAELMQWQLQTIIEQGKFLDYYFPLDQFQGTNVGLVENLTLRHPLATPRDADNYLARLALVSTRMDESVVEAKRLVGKKMIPPKFILQATIGSMQTFSGAPPEQNPLVTVFAEKIANIKELSDDQRSQLKSRAIDVVRKNIYPAWQRAQALLVAALPQSSDDAGLWRYPNGAAVYADALARFTTTTMTAEQIHQTGLQQVARIESEMDRILKSIGRTDGTVRERMNKLDKDLSYANPGSDEARAAIMKDVNGMLADAWVRSAPMFARTPKTPVIAQPFPKFRENAAAANYNRAPFDNSRPAIFQIPLRESRMTKLGLRTLVYHETVPGHHFQIALEQENTSLPRFRRARVLEGISALSEGWGLYAERIAAEEGWYKDDPEGLLGQLSAELFRARRLVVDTGLHAKHWTRQQAIDFGLEPSEVERYVVNPGQACSYMIGQLKLIELRDRARKQLGDKFSFKEFHSAVLDTGTVPLTLMEREVDRYIQSVQTGSSMKNGRS